jgi:hypothetical protein
VAMTPVFRLIVSPLTLDENLFLPVYPSASSLIMVCPLA